jgi:hypothetical protein
MVSNCVLVAGLLVLVAGGALRFLELNVALAVIGVAVGVSALVFAVFCYLKRDSLAASSPEEEAEDAGEEMQVDRKISKRSVSTSASSDFVFHVPSGSLERIGVSGDIEEARHEAIRN